MTEPLARAGFRRGLRPGAIADFLGEVLLGSGVGLPVPGPREPDQHVRTGLPERFVLEVGAGTVRVLDEAGAGELESWPRGEVDAWVHSLDEFETELELIWPDGERMGRIEAEGSPEAHAVAELLAADTRARRGADRRAEKTLRRLVGEVLPEKVRRDRHAALAEQATLPRTGGAAADRGRRQSRLQPRNRPA